MMNMTKGGFYEFIRKTTRSICKTIVEVGVNVQSGQEVVVSAFTESVDLVRLVAKHAYERGAKNVHIRWSDGVLTRLKYEHAPQDVFEQFPEWEAQMMETIAKRGGAFITILSESPDLLSGIDSKNCFTAKAAGSALHTYRQYVQSDKVAWTVVGAASKDWAKKIFLSMQMKKLLHYYGTKSLKSPVLTSQILLKRGKSMMNH